MRRIVSPSVLRRSALAVSVVALGFATLAPGQALGQTDSIAKKAAIDTTTAWDGAQNIQAFGCPNTTTYGQTITIPAGKSKLNKFVFYLSDFGQTGSMVARGEVYAWNGTSATGSALAETKAKTISYGDTDFHKVSFKAGGAKVTAGSQYVIFASIDKDFEDCTDPYTTGWGAVADTTYTSGTFVYQNNTGDETQWTTGFWNTFGLDLAFKAYLK